MFCPSCGTEYTIELKYCNRCGANLGALNAASTELISINVNKAIAVISTALAVVTGAGFFGVVVGAAKLSERAALGGDPVIALIVMGMATVLATDFLLIRQLSRLITASLSSVRPQPKQVSAPTGSFLPPQQTTARLERAPSVTENTTRFLEPEYRRPSDPDRDPPRA